MKVKKIISRLLAEKILILDGAVGTELYRRGMPPEVSPEVWSLNNPKVLKSVHREYQKAGSDIIYTSTFGANRIKLSQFGRFKVKEVNRELAMLAREAVGKKAFIAGDIGPTGHFVSPFGDLKFNQAVDIFKEQIRGLLEGGVDILAIETMMDIQEARAALLAAKEITDKFVIVTMTYEKDGRTINGTNPQSALITLQSLGADAVGCNCSSGPEGMLEIIKIMKPLAKVPLVSKPNAGMPKSVDGKMVFKMQPDEFCFYARRLVNCGANILGGCCGTEPGHIEALKSQLANLKPIATRLGSPAALSSAHLGLEIKKDKSLFIVGEKINPTGKKKMQKELLSGRLSMVRQFANEQKQNGARLLDVNVGVPGINEKETMLKVVNLLSASTELPLVIDSSRVDVIESALRIYPGRALINSISAERERLIKLLPLARKFGAMFILLPLDEKGIPESLDKRKFLIKKVLKKAKELGFSKEDIVVDALAMSAASNPEYAPITLKTIEWCTRTLKCNTIIGLSNISFGMPNRNLLNAAVLSLAKSKGLKLAIADPQVLTVSPRNILRKTGKEVSSVITYFSKIKEESHSRPKSDDSPIEDRIFRAVLEGNRDDIDSLIKEALRKGLSAYEIIEKITVPAILKVGDLFDQKKYFLPQLIASAETVKKAFNLLKGGIKRYTVFGKPKAVILMATVKGDIHDIGKNIVNLLLESNGFAVLDLGKDVSARKIISAIKRHHPLVVGLSALMTTTMVKMEEVVSLARKEKLKTKFMVGGAVVNAPYARSIGAVYAKDASEAVRVLRRSIRK